MGKDAPGTQYHKHEHWERLLESIPASYTVWNDSGTYRAESNIKGGTDYNGTVAETVINDALNGLTGGRTYKEKVLLKGNFTLTTDPIKIPSYTILEIQGKIALANSANCPLIRNANWAATNTQIDVIGGRLEGNSANNTGTYTDEARTAYANGIHFVEATNFSIRNVHVNDCTAFGMYLTAGTGGEVNAESMVTDCTINGTQAIAGPDYGDGIYSTYSNYRQLIIDTCYLTNNIRSGVYLEDYPKNITVSNSQFRSNLTGVAVANGYSINILGNQMRGTSTGVGRGIAIDGAYFDIVIMGNNPIELFGYDGIYLSGAGTGNSKVIGNTCKNNSKNGGANAAGIRLASDANQILGNKCYDDQGVKTQYSGLQIDVGEDYNIIIGNDFRNNATTNVEGWANRGSNSIYQWNLGLVTVNSGTSTGTGAQQTIAHGLASTPNRVWFSDIENGANPYQSAAADATNIYVTAGNTLDYVWKAEVV